MILSAISHSMSLETIESLESLDAGTEPKPQAEAGTRYSLRLSLLALVAACVLPAVLISTALVVQDYLLQRDRIYREAVLLARNLSSGLDRELAGVESGLRVLATSPDLTAGDLASFQVRARDALKFQVVENYVVLDPDGALLLDTARPLGQPLRGEAGPPELSEIFSTGEPVVTGLFKPPLGEDAIVAVGVPVYRGGEIRYGLSGNLSPRTIAAAFALQKLPEGWIAAILDRTGTEVARSRESELLVDKKDDAQLIEQSGRRGEGTIRSLALDGTPVFSAYSRSSISNWTVAVRAPEKALRAQLYRSVIWVALGAVLAFGTGVWWAVRVAEWVSDSIQALIAPALALGTGQPIEMAGSQLAEADAVAKALAQASRQLRLAQHLAHHDNLTGLCNRLLFDELVAHQVAIAQRTGSGVAVLAIDLDGFKSVNDQRGHSTGDLVLRVAADRIRQSIRASDVAARLGGDEFAVLLVSVSANQAQVVAEGLVAALAEPYPAAAPPVSASIGIAISPQSGVTATQLMESADAALYEAKRQGKRRAVLAANLAAAS